MPREWDCTWLKDFVGGWGWNQGLNRTKGWERRFGLKLWEEFSLSESGEGKWEETEEGKREYWGFLKKFKKVGDFYRIWKQLKENV